MKRRFLSLLLATLMLCSLLPVTAAASGQEGGSTIYVNAETGKQCRIDI